MKVMQNADGKMVGSVHWGVFGAWETGLGVLKSGRLETDTGRDAGKGTRNRADGGRNVTGGWRRIRSGVSHAGNGGGGVSGGVWDVREGGRGGSEGVQSVPNRSRDVPDGVFHTAKLIRNVPGISLNVGNGVGNGWVGGAGDGLFETQRRGGGAHRLRPLFSQRLPHSPMGVSRTRLFDCASQSRRFAQDDGSKEGLRPHFP